MPISTRPLVTSPVASSQSATGSQITHAPATGISAKNAMIVPHTTGARMPISQNAMPPSAP